MISPFIGASLCISLLLSTARSFSIGNHRNHIINRHPVHRHDRYHLPTIERISSGVGVTNTITNHLPGGDVSGTHVGNTGSSARLGRTYLPYLNYDLELFRNPSDLDVPDTTHRRPELPSTEHGWEGLIDISSSPTAFDLGWSIFVPNGVSASLFSTSGGRIIDSSPLVLTPDRKYHNPAGEEASSSSMPSSEILRSFLRTNQKWIDEQILEYGAVVFRGFAEPKDADSSSSSNKIAAIGKEILRAFNPGNDTRKGFGCYVISENSSGTESLSSTGQYTVLGGTKGSYPTRLSEISAHTRLTDWREIHDDLPPNLRRKLTEKHLLYKRSLLVEPASPEKLLPFRRSSSSNINERTTADEDDITEIDAGAAGTKPSSWFRLFGSTNKKAFEKTYRQIVEPIVQQQEKTAGMFEERLFVSEAFRCHPRTNEKIWFELAHRFHWTSLSAELLADFARTKNPWTLARAMRKASVSVWKRLCGESFPRPSSQRRQQEPETTTVSFGDGTPVSWWEMHQIRRAIRKNTAKHPWKPGDLLVADGLSMGLQWQ